MVATAAPMPKMASIRSCMDVSESTVSCTDAIITSAPTRLSPETSAETKQPTHVLFTSRPDSGSSTEGACCVPSSIW